MQQNTGEKKSKNKEKRTRVIKIRITGGVILAIVIVCVILKILNADPSSVFLKKYKRCNHRGRRNGNNDFKSVIGKSF